MGTVSSAVGCRKLAGAGVGVPRGDQILDTQSIITRVGNFYWLMSGALLGFGLMGIFSIGIPIFLVGMIMALYRVRHAGGRGFGLVLVGMGLLPVVYLSLSYFMADHSDTFYPDDLWKGLLVYVALAAAGAIWALLEAWRTSRP